MSLTAYYTDAAFGTLQQMDVVSGVSTFLENAPPDFNGVPDSIILDLTGTILYYTVFDNFATNIGTVRSYGLSSGIDAVVSNGGGTFSVELVDLLLDPSGTTLLLSDRANNRIVRVTIAGGAISTLLALNTPNGLAYDASHTNLYALRSDASPGLYKINPSTGAILTFASLAHAYDGLCFDSLTGLLWGASSNFLSAFNPSDCSLNRTSAATSGVIDGVASIGDGNIYAADGAFIRVYHIGSDTWTRAIAVSGSADDLCLAGTAAATPPNLMFDQFGGTVDTTTGNYMIGRPDGPIRTHQRPGSRARHPHRSEGLAAHRGRLRARRGRLAAAAGPAHLVRGGDRAVADRRAVHLFAALNGAL